MLLIAGFSLFTLGVLCFILAFKHIQKIKAVKVITKRNSKSKTSDVTRMLLDVDIKSKMARFQSRKYFNDNFNFENQDTWDFSNQDTQDTWDFKSNKNLRVNRNKLL